MITDNLTNLQQRFLVGGLSIVIGLIAIFGSYSTFLWPVFILFMMAAIGSAVWEYYHIAEAKGFHPLFKIGLIGTCAYIFAIYLRYYLPQALMLPELALWFTFVAAFLYYFIKGTDPFANLAVTMFGIIYLTVTLSCMVDINFMRVPGLVNDGRWCLLYLLLVTKITDMGAFFIGKKLGKTKLSPVISPKKTWEGAAGGLVSAIITSLILYACYHLFFKVPPFDLTFWQSIWLGALISVIGQFGDLAESLLKRDVGVKDSSSLPGLGGVLDVVDSLVFTAPFLYIFLIVQAGKTV